MTLQPRALRLAAATAVTLAVSGVAFAGPGPDEATPDPAARAEAAVQRLERLALEAVERGSALRSGVEASRKKAAEVAAPAARRKLREARERLEAELRTLEAQVAAREGELQLATRLAGLRAGTKAAVDLETVAAEAEALLARVEALDREIADATSSDPDGTTPLHRAARDGGLDRLRRLLARGASPAAADRRGMQPLHDACWAGWKDAVSVLLEAGASLEAEADEGPAVKDLPSPEGRVPFSHVRPLHLAAFAGHADVVALLLDRGALLDARGTMDVLPEC